VPWLSKQLLARLTADVAAYLTRPHVTAEVNRVIASDLGDGPTVVVGHSLGSIVAYWVLRTDTREVDVPLLITIGSPLGIDVVKRYLPAPLGMPPRVRHWLNLADRRDPVALYSRLDRDTFPAEIENVDDVHNPEDDPHGIVGYLSDTILCKRISSALSPQS
jgi:pimeloyl-ACP methyl ester carboxylesterase